LGGSLIDGIPPQLFFDFFGGHRCRRPDGKFAAVTERGLRVVARREVHFFRGLGVLFVRARFEAEFISADIGRSGR
jgi:hypothetical protein